MRVLIFTFHKAYSYGACLQAYATWKYFEKKKIKVAFVEYENEYEARVRNGKWVHYESFPEKVKLLVKKRVYQYDMYCEQAYSKFHKSIPCVSLNDIDEDDILIVGSDQTWNLKICNKLDEVFFLAPFKNIHKFALASSAGGYKYSREQIMQLKPMLEKFEEISVREEFTRKQFGDIKKDMTVILDPTLWLDASFWLDEIKGIPPIKENYILDFVFGNTSIEGSKDIIKRYSNMLNAPVYKIMLNAFKPKYVDKIIKGATPHEFLRWINDAKLVITNSFHGVAFSIILNTPFVFLPVNNSNNQRMLELLKKMALDDRVVSDKNCLISADMNFGEVNERLIKERVFAEKWINEKIIRKIIEGKCENNREK